MADTFTPERIAQLREILAKATPGEWHVPPHNESSVYGGAALVAITYPCGNGTGGTEVGGCTEESNANARQIVAAVNTLPAALDEIERLQNTVHARSYEHGLADSRGRVKVLEAQLSHVTAERDSLIDQVRAMSGVSATLSRVTAERDEAVRVMEPFARAVEKADGRARGSGFAPSFDIYRTLWEFSFGELRAARSFLSRMGGRK